MRRDIVQVSLGCHYNGAAFPHADPRHPATLEAGFRKRMATKPPPSSRSLRRRFRTFVSDWVRRNLIPLDADVDLGLEKWLESTLYPLARKQQLRAAHIRVESDPSRSDRKWTQVQCFGKHECYPTYKHGRVIYARADEFKTIVGPLFRMIEDRVYAHPSFIKHVPVFSRAEYVLKLLKSEGATYIATDYTAYESHFTKRLMEDCEFILYDWMVRDTLEGRNVLDYYKRTVTGMNHCVFRNLMYAQMPAGRMSGEMTTSLGNGFTNLMLFLFMCKHFGLRNSAVVVEGDDALGRLFLGPGHTVAQIQQYYTLMGMNVKLELHRELNMASFCGLVFDEINLVNVPDPIKAILNFGWIDGRYKGSSSRTLAELLRGKAMSLMCMAQGCPVLQSLAMYGLRVTQGRYRIDDYWLRQQINKSRDRMTPIHIAEATRLVMEKKYKITVHDQLLLEKYFDSLTSLVPLVDELLLPFLKDDQCHYFQHFVLHSQEQHPVLALPDQKT